LKTAYIGIIAAVVTVIWKIIEAGVSYKEGTFSLRQLEKHSRIQIKFHGQYRWQHLPMSFMNNWAASWGDMIIFPIINALVISSLWLLPSWQWDGSIIFVPALFFIVGIVVSVIFHRAWWGHDENLGHVFVGWNIGHTSETRVEVEHNNFYDDIAKAGWVHFWFMAAQSAIVLAWIPTPMPLEVIIWVSLLLSVFVAVQQIQATLIQKGDGLKHFLIACVEICAIMIIGSVKEFAMF